MSIHPPTTEEVFEQHGIDLDTISLDKTPDGELRCPCKGCTKSFENSHGLSLHHTRTHDTPVIQSLLQINGHDGVWRTLMEELYVERNFPIDKIADALPGHTGSTAIRNSLEGMDVYTGGTKTRGPAQKLTQINPSEVGLSAKGERL